MPLTDVALRSAKPGPSLKKLSDGGGLQLWIQPTGSKLWRCAYRFDGKQKVLAVGAYPIVGLLEARRARDDVKRMLQDGNDPSALRRTAKGQEKAHGATFAVVAAEYVSKLKAEARADTTLDKVRWLVSLAAKLHDRPIAELKPGEVLEVLRVVEARGRRDTAKRLRSTIGAISRYAIATGRSEGDPTTALRGALLSPVVKSRAAITDPKQFGSVLCAIDSYGGQPATRIALQLMALLFPRPGELRAAEWVEFDTERAIWTIPASRAKMRRPHRVPLPRQAIALLAELRAFSTGALLFPGIGRGRNAEIRHLSETTMNAALQRLGYGRDEHTPHGFRATASTLLNESNLWSSDAIERALAHQEEDAVRRAYARGEHWDERVRMAQWWGDHLDALRVDVGKRSRSKQETAATA